jgi:hypothetical protein
MDAKRGRFYDGAFIAVIEYFAADSFCPFRRTPADDIVAFGPFWQHLRAINAAPGK